MIGNNLLERIRRGEPDAVAHFKEILRLEGVVGTEEVFELQLASVSAALAQTGRGKGAMAAKIDIYYNIFEKLSSIRTAALTEGAAGTKAVAERLAAESEADTARAWLYDKLLMLAMAGPEGDREGLDAPRSAFLKALSDNIYSPAIQVGAALAKAGAGKLQLDDGFIKLANACLLNAVRYCGGEARKYATEAISLHGDAATKAAAAGAIMETVRRGTGEEKREAIGLLLDAMPDEPAVRKALHTLGLGNGEVKAGIAAIAQAMTGASEAAGAIMKGIRTEDERESARADRDTLLETEYQHEYMPQRMYVELVFGAVERVIGPRPGTPKEETEYAIAVMQLATQGADPGQIKGLFASKSDEHNLRMIRRNVENALLFAVNNNYSDETSEQAARGLVKIGSARAADILDRIARRHGSDSRAGVLAAETAQEIRNGWVQEIVEPKSIRKLPPPLPPKLSQRLRQSQ
jgi:hypothetical protein